MYADETGNLDLDGAGNERAGAHFGFGTAVFNGDHGDHLFGGLRLRAELEAEGLSLTGGFHAVDDRTSTRNRMFQLIREQAPRFDTTFLYKPNARQTVRDRGQMYLYRLAWFLHFKEIAVQVSKPGDTLYVIVAAFGTAAKRTEARVALEEVCSAINRDVVLCVWNAGTSWGLQVADYGLWATHRRIRGKHCSWFEPCIQPTLRSVFRPWEPGAGT